MTTPVAITFDVPDLDGLGQRKGRIALICDGASPAALI